MSQFATVAGMVEDLNPLHRHKAPGNAFMPGIEAAYLDERDNIMTCGCS